MTTETDEQLDVGMHYGLTRETYDAIPAYNASSLKIAALEGVRAYRRNQLQGWKDSMALSFGRAFHLVMQGHPVDFAAIPSPTKTAAKAWAELQQKHPEQGVIPEGDIAMLSEMKLALGLHPIASALFDSVTADEVAIVWDCPHTGVRCKALVDAIADGVLIDWKTTLYGNRRQVVREVERRGYDLQMAFYLTGLHAVGKTDINEVYNVFIQKTPILPEVFVYEYTPEMLSDATDRFVEAIRKVEAAKAADTWDWSEPETIDASEDGLCLTGFDDGDETEDGGDAV